MANVPNKLLHSLSIALFFFFLITFEVASARPLNAPPIHPAGLSKTGAGEKNPSEENSVKHETKNEIQVTNYGKLLFAYGPSLMSMLPKGAVPVSGPSRRINDAKN